MIFTGIGTGSRLPEPPRSDINEISPTFTDPGQPAIHLALMDWLL